MLTNKSRYFITQVGLSAASFGVATSDVTAVGMALEAAFGYRCEPETAIPSTAVPDLQSICTDSTCPVSPLHATCSAYSAAIAPSFMNGTVYLAPGGSNSTNGTSTTPQNGTGTSG